MSKFSQRAAAWLAVPAASLAAFLIGLDLAYILPVVDSVGFQEDVVHMRLAEGRTPNAVEALIRGLFTVGCVAAALPTAISRIAGWWGCRLSIALGGGAFIAGCVLQMEAPDLKTFYAGRVVTGCSVGILSTVVPAYMAEVSSAKGRGGALALFQVMVSCGMFVAIVLNMCLLQLDGGWHLIIRVQTIPAAVVVLSMCFVPDSPRWLVQKGRYEEAEATFAALHGSTVPGPEYEDVVRECAGEEDAHPRPAPRSSRLGLLVAGGCAMQVLSRIAGIHGAAFVGQRMIQSFGVAGDWFTAGASVVGLASALLAAFLADSTGRRTLLVFGSVCLAVCSVILGVLGPFVEHTLSLKYAGSGSSAVAAILSTVVVVFYACFSCTWGTMVWVYLAEIFPARHRVWCLGATTTTHWAVNYVVAHFTPALLGSLGFAVFFVFCGFQVVGLFIAMWLPETNGVPLEQVGSMFDKKFNELFGLPMSDTKSYGATRRHR